MEYTDTSYRNSARIILDDFAIADGIFQKLRPYLGDIEALDHADKHQALKGRRGMDDPSNGAHLLRLNERLRFLRYGPGQFFQSHCDGAYWTPDKKQVTYYTLQIYLNGDSETLKGGATRFWSQSHGNYRPPTRGFNGKSQPDAFVDVEARLGRVVVFEHEGLLHSGEPVKSGLKYTLRSDFLFVENGAGDSENLVGDVMVVDA